MTAPITLRDSIVGRHHVQVLGSDGPTLLMAHGFGCDQSMWRKLWPAFEATHRIVLFDYVGCGRSDWAAYEPQRYASLNGYAQDIIDVLDALELSSVTLVGHSVSGVVAMLAAIQRSKQVDSVVMVAPSPRYLDDPPHYRGGFQPADVRALLDMINGTQTAWADHLAGAVSQEEPDGALRQELHDSFCAMEPSIARRFAEVTFFSDNRADLRRLLQPTLVLQCERDVVAPPSVGRYMADQLPCARLEALSVSGHCPHISHPELTAEAMRRFMSNPPRPKDPVRLA